MLLGAPVTPGRSSYRVAIRRFNRVPRRRRGRGPFTTLTSLGNGLWIWDSTFDKFEAPFVNFIRGDNGRNFVGQ